MAKIIQFWDYNDTSGVICDGLLLVDWNIKHQLINGVKPQVEERQLLFTWPQQSLFDIRLRGSQPNPWGSKDGDSNL